MRRFKITLTAFLLVTALAPSAWAQSSDCSVGYKGYNCVDGVWVETHEANDAPCPPGCGHMATLEETGLKCDATTGNFHTNTLCIRGTIENDPNPIPVPEMNDLLVPAFIIAAGGIVFLMRRRRA